MSETSIRLEEAAESDIAHAFEWYEATRAGLGDEFVAALAESFERLVEWPESSPVVHHDVRRTLLRRFPFSVYYLVDTETLVIIAVLHTASNPVQWRRRVED